MVIFLNWALKAYRFLRSLFTPTVDDVVNSFDRQIAKLERVIDDANDEVLECTARRRVLRDAIDETWSAQGRAEARAERASRVRDNLKEIIA